MNTTVLLLRHGDTDLAGHTLAGWTLGVHLNESGKRQAERLVARLAGVPVGAIYSSPLERAQETVAPLAARLGLAIRTCEALGEIRTGDWTGRKISDLENDPVWRRFNTQRSTTRIPGGETMLEVQTRMVEAIEGMRTSHPGEVVLAASHGDPIRGALLHYLGMPLDFIHRLEIQTASISFIALHDGGPVVLRINDTGELP
jgi:probable phosphoglycerate mutase